MSINYEVMVTCAVTGAGDTVDKHPAIPVTPTQIANAAIEAADAGAAIVHLHVRNPQTGAGSRDIDLFRQTVQLVRNSSRDVLINLTAGMGGALIVNDDAPTVSVILPCASFALKFPRGPMLRLRRWPHSCRPTRYGQALASAVCKCRWLPKRCC